MSRKYDAIYLGKPVALPPCRDQIPAMRTLLPISIGFAVALTGALPAIASSSAWHNSEGGRIRLVTSGAPDKDGRIDGVLDIALKPGWKTYWRDPGASGVPPQIDIGASSNVDHVTLSFPAPKRHDDGYGAWSGYDHSVALPVVFTLASPGKPTTIDANVFLGICETICIPLQATLQLDPATDPDNADDTALVKAGFDALPEEPKAGFEAKLLPGDHETMLVEVATPPDAGPVDFFVAGEDQYMFGTPTRSESSGKIIFSVPILDRPAGKPDGTGLHYTLTTDSGAVQGLLPYP